MLKPPNISNLPGISAMTDTLEFVKNLWGGMNVPGVGMPSMVMPTLSVNEINKQIKDLKAVEAWLTVNMNMLRGTIQALEVQAATISALQSMGESFSSTVKDVKEKTGLKTAEEPKEPGKKENPFQSEQKAESRRKARNALKAEFKGESEPLLKTETKPGEPRNVGSSSGYAAPLANPAAWWGMLQDQFKQAVNSAIAAEPLKPAAAAKPGTTTPRKRKSPPKSG